MNDMAVDEEANAFIESLYSSQYEIWEGLHEGAREEDKGIMNLNFDKSQFYGLFGLGTGKKKEVIGRLKVEFDSSEIKEIVLSPLYSNSPYGKYIIANQMGNIKTAITEGKFQLMGAEFHFIRKEPSPTDIAINEVDEEVIDKLNDENNEEVNKDL